MPDILRRLQKVERVKPEDTTIFQIRHLNLYNNYIEKMIFRKFAIRLIKTNNKQLQVSYRLTLNLNSWEEYLK